MEGAPSDDKPYADHRRTPFDALIEERQGGVLVPSAFCQFSCRSKVNQAKLFRDHMIPHTRVISCRQDLLAAVIAYGELGISKVVTKEDRGSGGARIHLWNDMELLYALKPCKEPFVLQPFLEHYSDIRVVVVGDYIEAYGRENLQNFRNNLGCGGASRAFPLTQQHIDFCREVMTLGDYPFAHLDLFVVSNGEDEKIYLSEIALGGGLKGAKISLKECNRLKCEIIDHQKAQLRLHGAAK
nr:hypothetical protein [uncultured Desulfuromonas sp.]